MVFTTAARDVPAACSTCCRLLSTCRVWEAIPPSTISPVAGLSPIWPAVKTIVSVAIAWEYGPIAFGASRCVYDPSSTAC